MDLIRWAEVKTKYRSYCSQLYKQEFNVVLFVVIMRHVFMESDGICITCAVKLCQLFTIDVLAYIDLLSGSINKACHHL